MIIGEVIAGVLAAKAERLDVLSVALEWHAAENRIRFVALISTLTVWAVGDRAVIVAVIGVDVALWGYVAAEILDAGAAAVELPDSARLHKLDAGRYALAW